MLPRPSSRPGADLRRARRDACRRPDAGALDVLVIALDVLRARRAGERWRW
jgi:hypothetical protein